jgi:hypothetical protein
MKAKNQGVPIFHFNVAEGSIAVYQGGVHVNTVTGIHSGNAYSNQPQYEDQKMLGPIPKGTYYIEGEIQHGQNPSVSWHWLDSQQPDGSYSHNDGSANYGRGEFGLHPGVRSNGCVSCGSDVPESDKENYPKSPGYDVLNDYLNKSPGFHAGPKNQTFSGVLIVD